MPTNIEFRWAHGRDSISGVRATSCTAYKVQDSIEGGKAHKKLEPLATAIARTHPNDNFCKHTGRVKSLGKVLKVLVPKTETDPPAVRLGKKKTRVSLFNYAMQPKKA